MLWYAAGLSLRLYSNKAVELLAAWGLTQKLSVNFALNSCRLGDFRLSLRCTWGLRASGMLHGISWWLVTLQMGPISCSETSVTNQQSTPPNIPEVQRPVMADCVCWRELPILIITKQLRICRYYVRIFHNEGGGIKVGSFVPLGAPARPSGRNELANYCLYPSASNFE